MGAVHSFKSNASAYGWWLVGGGLGLHRFYVGHNRIGYAILAAMIATCVFGLLANLVDSAIWLAWLVVAPFLAVVIVDLFLIPRHVKHANRQLREDIDSVYAASEVEL